MALPVVVLTLLLALPVAKHRRVQERAVVSLRQSRGGCTGGSCVVPQREQTFRAEMGLLRRVLPSVSAFPLLLLPKKFPSPTGKRGRMEWGGGRKEGVVSGSGGGVTGYTLPSFANPGNLFRAIMFPFHVTQFRQV